ncbi:MAG TPA: DNA recombination protein RmuC [Flavobacteriales bacterium]|jgi:DNA recombination protein RmuC|nr:DNA recombination protein RmuC [Flavobacteriales bacterium]
MDYLPLLIGFVLGIFAPMLVLVSMRKRLNLKTEEFLKKEVENTQLSIDLATAENKLENHLNEVEELKNRNEEIRSELRTKTEELIRSTSQRASLEQQNKELKEFQEQLKLEFENIGNKILKTNAESLVDQNQKQLHSVLDPLKQRISDFERKVDETYDKELRDKTSLKKEIENLTKLNAQLSEDATNLTKALKGDSKLRGNWGELVLERVLELSGLEKDREYRMEVVVHRTDGTLYRPDAVVYLPDNKHIIIDSKVSLVAYEQLSSATDSKVREMAVRNHIKSIRNHIKELSEKKYFDTDELASPEFTLMFIPIESSFSVALKSDVELFNYAWSNKIVLVSPTTLLATLRTIASLWKQEKQTRNVMEIARLGSALYNKFRGFVNDMEDIKKGLKKSQEAYDGAMNKLTEGRGNMIRTADKMRELGVKTKDKLPDELVNLGIENDEQD